MARRMLTLSALMVVGMLAQGCTGTRPGENPNPNDPPPVEPLKAGIEIATNEASLVSGSITNSVNFVYLRDLWVRVKVPGMSRTTKVKLNFVNPRGEVSYEDTTPYTNDATMKAMQGNLGHDITVFQAKGIPGGYAFDRPIPVAGSVLQRIPAPEGQWTLEAEVEGYAEKLVFQFNVTNQR